MNTNRWIRQSWNPLGCAALLVALAGCAAPIHRQAVPQGLLDAVRVQGMPSDIRDWGDRPSPALRKSVADAYAQAAAEHGTDAPADVLAISGGGSNGAYAAGLLCGWTNFGSRPSFRVVTGVSVGALIAPLAFLGSEHDGRLREMTRAARDETIYRGRGGRCRCGAPPRPRGDFGHHRCGRADRLRGTADLAGQAPAFDQFHS
jgi:hypothetical protein